jgi:hypothetical protein
MGILAVVVPLDFYGTAKPIVPMKELVLSVSTLGGSGLSRTQPHAVA